MEHLHRVADVLSPVGPASTAARPCEAVSWDEGPDPSNMGGPLMNKVWLAGVLSLLLATIPDYAHGQPPAGQGRGGACGRGEPDRAEAR